MLVARDRRPVSAGAAAPVAEDTAPGFAQAPV
jgi:hypothetical protein